MMDNYCGRPAPELTIGFLDIEVDYDPAIGFAGPKNPYAKINAITIYRTDLREYISLGVPPQGWAGELPLEMQDANYLLFDTEKQLLEYFLQLIEDVDVLSGWNSDFYDLPYIGKRLEMVFGPHALKLLAFERGSMPRWGEYERFKGSKEKDLILTLDSRVHLDYLRLFRKFNLEGRQSHGLDAIGRDEVGKGKLKYDGTLAELYNKDFIKFLVYNRDDCEILVMIDDKFHYIQLANEMVHEATVNFGAVFGSVQLIDTAIMNFCHTRLKRILFDRSKKPSSGVEGAIVMTPKVGLHRWVGSCDINSLYPSTYRSLNLSPEKIIGQLLEQEKGWRAVYSARENPDRDDLWEQKVSLHMEGDNLDDVIKISIRNLIELLEEKKWALSAHGTVLDQANGQGLIPAVLGYWFEGRKDLQKKKKDFAKKAKVALETANGDKTNADYLENKRLSEYYDMLQGVRKVLLNSTYGATLNEYCRFYDQRLGSSTTDTGRQITTHMVEKVASCLLGENHPKVKKTSTLDKKSGEMGNEYTIETPNDLGPFYSDTDSCYFIMERLIQSSNQGVSPDEVVEQAATVADAVVSEVNDSFPIFMRQAFFCQPEFDDKIKANREVVAETGIFRAKKKYVMFVRDLEGVKIDPNDDKAMKTQGSDIKLSSTPETIRGMLKEVTMGVMKGKPKAEIDEFILEFRKKLTENIEKINVLEFATVSSIKSFEEYYVKWERIEKPGLGKVNIPYAARAVINYNNCIDVFSDKENQKIMAGQKIKIIWLKDNDFNYKNIAFPSEATALPSWFKQNFEVDLKATEEKLIDGTIRKIFDPIGWQVPTPQTVMVNKLLDFD